MELKNLDSHLAEKYPTRFKREEKDAFSIFVAGVFKKIGYDEKKIKIINMKDSFDNNNIIVGNPNAKYIFTAHYDTPGKTGYFIPGSKIWGTGIATLIFAVVAFIFWFGCVFTATRFLPQSLSFAQRYFISLGILLALLIVTLVIPMLSKNKHNRNDNTSGVLGVIKLAEMIFEDSQLRDDCAFVLFDNEEWGLLGSSAYKKWCKKNGYDLSNSAVINLDCIGQGDNLTLFTNSKSPISKTLAEKFNEQGAEAKLKNSSLVFMSDHFNFKNSVMISRTSVSKFGFIYMPNIHTSKDTECDTEKIEELTDMIYNAVK